MDLSKIKLICSSFDGIVTSGSAAIDEMGYTAYKEVYLDDFRAINQLKSIGLKFVFLSGDNAVSYNYCRKKNVPFYWVRTDKKTAIINEVLRRYKLTPDEVLFIAVSLDDVSCAKLIPCTFCPKDAPSVVRKHSLIRINASGGNGVLVELLEIIRGNLQC